MTLAICGIEIIANNEVKSLIQDFRRGGIFGIMIQNK
jgi:hypothetical protein